MRVQTAAPLGSIQRASIRTLVLVCLAPVSVLAAVTLLAHWNQIEIGWMLHDASSLGRLPFYAGFTTKLASFCG